MFEGLFPILALAIRTIPAITNKHDINLSTNCFIKFIFFSSYAVPKTKYRSNIYSTLMKTVIMKTARAAKNKPLYLLFQSTMAKGTSIAKTNKLKTTPPKLHDKSLMILVQGTTIL